MKQGIGSTLAALALFAAFTGSAGAQDPTTGTESGANTATPAAGTGNAGDRTAQPGSTPPAAKHVRKHRRHHHHKAAAASSPQ